MVLVAALGPGTLLLPGTGPDGSTARVEAVSDPDATTSTTSPLNPAGPGEPELANPPVDQLRIDGSGPARSVGGQGPLAFALPGVPALQPGPGDGAAGAGDGDADGEGAGEGTEADGDGTEANPDGDGSTPPAGDTTTTAPPTTAAPAPATPSPPSGSAPGTGVRELYVDGARGWGHNPGTKDRPFKRPIEAISIAEPGTTVYLRGGTYDFNTHGAFSIRRSGTAQNWIRIAPYPGERVEYITGGEWGNGFEFLGAKYVELSGFVLRGRNDSIHGSGVFIKNGSHDLRIIGNDISGFGGAGISLISGGKVTIEGNFVHDNAFRSHYQGSGISIYKPTGPLASGNGFTNVIRGNYVVHNYNAVPHAGDGRITDGNCIIMDRTDEVGYQGRTLIENNVCAENGGRGVHTYRSSNVVARNNTLYHNMWTSEITGGRGELTAGEGRNILFVNNLVFNRPGVASFVSNKNQNTSFVNNWVASGPPPGDGNRVLPEGNYFSSTARGGRVEQWRPLGGAGLAGTSNGNQPSVDLTGRNRPGRGAIGALEP